MYDRMKTEHTQVSTTLAISSIDRMTDMKQAVNEKSPTKYANIATMAALDGSRMLAETHRLFRLTFYSDLYLSPGLIRLLLFPP